MSKVDEPGGKDRSDRLSHYDDSQAAIRAMLALDAGGLGCWEWDIAANETTGDPFLADLFDLDYDAQPWPSDKVFEAIHPDDLPSVQAALEQAMQGDGEFAMEFREVRRDPDTGADVIRWLGGRGRVTSRSEDGEPLRMIGVTRDVTVEKTAEAQLTALASEMDHRVKNAFAVIRALINLGERTSGDGTSFAGTLKAQVQAMADAHKLSADLARSNRDSDQPIPMLSVARAALAPWLDRPEPARAEILITGNEHVAVTPRDVSALAMLLYELATNAARHGALGMRGGRLEVDTERRGEDEVILIWTETADDERPLNDGGEGFGSAVMQHCIRTLRGTVRREIGPRGLRFELIMPVPPATIDE
ncbi:sensor histidine kinase [Roseobacter sp. HKCCA0434]|uniref:sensor histidine kinase n=1 Tax=Roseobacter sp. HKCCA0434 TaxID=3079297 RepID=UPI002905B0C5|nr:HWE histidine kinase domain-containing protein [Roseobacter sp. HKCCA0434]